MVENQWKELTNILRSLAKIEKEKEEIYNEYCEDFLKYS